MSVPVRCPSCDHLAFVQPEDILTAFVTCTQCGLGYEPTGPEPEEPSEPVPQPRGRRREAVADENADEPERSPRRHGRSSSGKPEDVLTPKQYLNYQHGRILSGLFVFFGGIFLLAGIAQAVASQSDPAADPSAAFWMVCAVIGFTGVVGGGAAYQGNRAWSRVGYLFAVVLLCGIPIGTVISILWMLGLSRYFEAAERVRRARDAEA